MKKTLIFLAVVAMAMMASGCASKIQDQTIDTTELGKDVIGYKGPVPVQISIKNGKVESVIALENEETPRFFDRAAVILDSWNGLKVDKAKELKVDAVSGATYTSNAIIENVRLGLEAVK